MKRILLITSLLFTLTGGTVLGSGTLQINPYTVTAGKSYISELTLENVGVTYQPYGTNGYYKLQKGDKVYFTKDYMEDEGMVYFYSREVLNLSGYTFMWDSNARAIIVEL